MKFYKIVVAYDGLNYYGWQIQPVMPTITSVLQERFKAVFKKDIHIIGASRTDAQVHALGQVASFSCDIDISNEKMLNAWNNLLPIDVLIRKLELVSEDFHPQANVLQKTYYYHIFSSKPVPFFARYGYYKQMNLDIDKFKECLNVFVGKHDFRSFCTGYEQESTIRTIDEINVSQFKRFNAFRIEVKGPAFLRYMIRRIVGASMDIASTTRPIEELHKALEARDPQQHLFTVPGYGLMLKKILYHNVGKCNLM